MVTAIGDNLTRIFTTAANSTVEVVSSVAPLIQPVVDEIVEAVDYRRGMIRVPELCVKDFRVTLEQAEQQLIAKGLNIIATPLVLADAEPAYRDYIHMQVVDTHPKGRTKVEEGDAVKVRFITQEIIDESKKIFEQQEAERIKLLIAERKKREQEKLAKLEAERQAEADKAEQKKQREIAKRDRKEIRVAKRNEQINSIKKVSSEVANNLQSTVKKVPAVFKIKPKGDEKA